MFRQCVRASFVKSRMPQLFAGAAMLIVVGVGSDLQAQMQCGGGRAGGGQVAGRTAGPGAAMGGGTTQFAQMMQMLQQAQQLQQLQRQAAIMQQARLEQAREQHEVQARQQRQTVTTSATSQSSSATRPTMTRRERLRLLIQQRRAEQSQKRPSRRELAIQRSSRNRQPKLLASVETPSTETPTARLDN